MQSFMSGFLIEKLRQALPQLAASEVFLQNSQESVGKVALRLGALKAREALHVLADISTATEITELECAEIVCALAELTDGQDAFNESFMETLHRLQTHSSALVRGMLVKIYAQIGDLASVNHLRELSKDSDAFVRGRAVQVLLRLDSLKQIDDDVSGQIEALSHSNLMIQAGAVAALKKQGHPSAVMPLFAFIQSFSVMEDKKLRAEALRALANCLTGAEQGLLDSLLLIAKEPNPEIHAAVLLCLGRVSDAQGRSLQPIILGLLSMDRNINAAAAVALSEGFRSEHEHLLKFLIEIYGSSNLSLSSREALLIAFSRVAIADARLKGQLRTLIADELKSKVLNIRKTAIVILEGLYDDEHPVPIEVARLLRDLLFDKNKEIQIVSASFLAKHGLR
jgi:HEAT repeat protein